MARVPPASPPSVRPQRAGGEETSRRLVRSLPPIPRVADQCFPRVANQCCSEISPLPFLFERLPRQGLNSWGGFRFAFAFAFALKRLLAASSEQEKDFVRTAMGAGLVGGSTEPDG